MNTEGYVSYFTNHSLRVSAATKLFAAGVDEQLIMSRTEHSSVNEFCTYKCKVEKLQEIMSDMLNTGSNTDKSIAKPSEEVVENRCKIVRSCDGMPSVNVSGGSNVSINTVLWTE